MRWLDKAINFYTEWNENDKRKSSRFDISNESDFLRDYTGIRSVSIGLNYKGTDPYDSLISLLKNAKDLQKEIEESMDTVLSVYTQRQKKKTFRFRGGDRNAFTGSDYVY